ncbi:helicase [Sesbania bispinosa]|nr:helicase [Sesbania bispinosa]
MTPLQGSDLRLCLGLDPCPSSHLPPPSRMISIIPSPPLLDRTLSLLLIKLHQSILVNILVMSSAVMKVPRRQCGLNEEGGDNDAAAEPIPNVVFLSYFLICIPIFIQC